MRKKGTTGRKGQRDKRDAHLVCTLAHADEKWRCAHFEQRARSCDLWRILRSIFFLKQLGCRVTPILPLQSANPSSSGSGMRSITLHCVRGERICKICVLAENSEAPSWQCCGEAAQLATGDCSERSERNCAERCDAHTQFCHFSHFFT